MRITHVIIVLAFCSRTVVWGAQYVEEWGAVDMRPVLRVGDMQVSGYLAAKHFKRFVQSSLTEGTPPSDAAAFEQWKKLFVADHVIIADLMRQGQGDTPEVRTAVEEMEHHMLTDPVGPIL